MLKCVGNELLEGKVDDHGRYSDLKEVFRSLSGSTYMTGIALGENISKGLETSAPIPI